MKKRTRMFLPVLVILAMLASMLGMGIPVVADFDPADSDTNVIVLYLTRPNLIYHIGDTINFKLTVEVPVAGAAGNPGKCTAINTTFTRPDGVVVYLPTIPELNRGESVAFNSTTYPSLAYVIDFADADPSGAVSAAANVTAISHCSTTGPAPGGNEYAYDERDISTQIAIEPDICIEKLVDCNDDQVYLHEDTGSYGDTPSWKITVWNCGDSPLHAVNVTDTNGMSWGPFDLAINGTWSVNYTGSAIYETTTNNASAVALDVLGGVVGPVYDSATNVITGGEGCTPGFWKNNARNWDHSAWMGYLPGDSFETVFNVTVTLRANGKNTYPAPTLLEALDANGGGINALARHAVAALLNIANTNIAYGIGSTGALITMVHDAIVSGDEAQIEALHTLLAGYNEAGCPLNQKGEPIIPDGIVA